jgi:hypothetical protein
VNEVWHALLNFSVMAFALPSPYSSRRLNLVSHEPGTAVRHRRQLTVHAAVRKGKAKNVVCNKTLVAKQDKVRSLDSRASIDAGCHG